MKQAQTNSVAVDKMRYGIIVLAVLRTLQYYEVYVYNVLLQQQ